MLISKPATSPLKDDVTDLAYKAALDPVWRDEFFNNSSVRATVKRSSRIFWKRYGMSNRYPEPRDLEQEIWFKLLKYIHTFEKKSSFKTWVDKITKNLAIEEQRRQERLPCIIDLNDRVLEEQASPDTSREAVLGRCINKLSDSEIRLLEYFLARKKLVEIARELDMKKSTAHNRLKALRKKIMTLIES